MQPSKAEQLVGRGDEEVARFSQVSKLHSCEYGHLDCSSEHRGPCQNEVALLVRDNASIASLFWDPEWLDEDGKVVAP